MKTLNELLVALPDARLWGDGSACVAGIKADSRKVQPGDLFLAYQGKALDGHRYIGSAVAQGASVVVGERAPAEVEALLGGPLAVPYVQVANGRQALAYLAAAWYDFPARKLRVIGVTGTDGKTTTATLITSILEVAGHRTGLVSTVSAVIGGREQETGFHTTTPEALDMQHYLAEMVEAEAEYAVLESTSHGLAQHRVDACEYDVAVVTNITHEHLDEHGSFEAYRDAKAQLFRHLSTAQRKGIPEVSVINVDDPSYPYLRVIPADEHWSYGLDSPAGVTATDITFVPSGLTFTAHTPRGEFRLESRLVGRFNVYNILAAVTATLSQGVPVSAIQAGVSAMRGVRGRMDPIDLGQDFAVLIDFAHTPNALEQALKTVRQLTAGKVIVVFGCAGLRDRQKRPMMGEVACRLADRSVLTAEDPRTEPVEEIIAQTVVGCQQAGGQEGRDFFRVPDRGEAIQTAIDMAEPGDLVVITGKGHEPSMCYGTVEYPWSDHEAAWKALKKRLGLL
ncbi:MAG: UDP-N-acetylmuramoyl-L-alanyl-D-glutamate--2,6-diaminopimelate ligase [Chloroflexi bacterium]|nr:UDP-N-acetylmuramoyl-L-alanyl-D-glutamate--2,6-diaminopimelate ligase [Chloroflexota bacterium]